MKILITLTLFLGMVGAAHAIVLSQKNLDEIKLACTDPSSSGNQSAPSEISLTCSEVITTWLATISGSLSLTRTDVMKTSIETDKPDVGASEETSNLPMLPLNANCPKYNQVKLSASMVFNLTCEEVEGISNLATYCKERFDQESAGNPNFYTITPTGAVRDTCSGQPTQPLPTK